LYKHIHASIAIPFGQKVCKDYLGNNKHNYIDLSFFFIGLGFEFLNKTHRHIDGKIVAN
jgi:hypothetical protein